jgi:hypothetical protein
VNEVRVAVKVPMADIVAPNWAFRHLKLR